MSDPERTPRPPAPVIELSTGRPPSGPPRAPSSSLAAKKAPPPPPTVRTPFAATQVSRTGVPSTVQEAADSGVRDATERAPSLDGPASAGFSARIEGASLADLVQMECLRGLTRAFRVHAPQGIGTLFFDQGQVVHAEAGFLRGERAALEILSWSAGRVEPCDAYWVRPPTITTGWQGLLMAAMQRVDEGQASSRRGAEAAPAVGASHRPDARKERASRIERVDHLRVEDVEEVSGEEVTDDPTLDAATEQKELSAKAQAKMDTPTEKGETLEPGVVRAVRISADGTVIGGVGDAEELADAAAYAFRLAELVGEGLGLDGFTGIECRLGDNTVIGYREKGTIVMLEALPETGLAKYRERAGT